jgi:hypothetical protein
MAAFERLYRDDIRYYETPFDEPMTGLKAVRAYAETNAGAQTNIKFGYEPLAVADGRAFAHWWASFERVPSGVKVQLDGFAAVRLDDQRRCFEFREWWHRQES